jgi:hypothetical protein
MKSSYLDMAIELIEVPPFPRSLMRVDSEAALRTRDVGHFHVCMDCTRACLTLGGLIAAWNTDSVAKVRKTIRVLLEPEMRRVGGRVMEVAMIADADGNIVELLRRTGFGEEEGGDEGGGNFVEFEWEDDGPKRDQVAPVL